MGREIFQGNLIGTNISGTAALANGRHGVWVLQSGSGNMIGGTATGAGNVVSGNTQVGVLVESSSGTVIQGNFIGVNAAGQAKLGNVRDGVVVFNGPNTTIGGTAAGAGNVIGGNGLPGITIAGTGATVVHGNWIGTNAAGDNLGNSTTGVLVTETSGHTIGGSPGGNTIAFNGADGIAITARFAGQSVGNQIQANSIYSNVGLGIDLGDNGPDFPQDAFNGPGLNNRQDFPILTEVIATEGGTTVSGTLLGANGGTKHRIDFFANAATDATGFGEGQTFLGSLVVNSVNDNAGIFTATLPVLPAGQPLVTTTATDITDRGSGPLNNTSEFSPPFLPPTVYTVTTTADSGAGSLRAAITAANAHAGFDRIEFAIVATDAGHFYYQDDGVAGQVTLAKVAATTAVDDAGLPTTGTSAADPDWPHAWFSIRPTAALPEIFEPVVIDGYTQAGATANTNPAPQGLNTVLRIEVSGQDAGPPPVGFQPGLLKFRQAGAASTIRGLVINRGEGAKLALANGMRVEGNFVGPDVSGTLAFAGPATNGIEGGLSTVIGGLTAPQRNLISANLTGVNVGIDSATSVQGNLIGTDRTGAQPLGNTYAGVTNGRGATIGGPTPAAANVISGNFVGVLATGGTFQNNLIGTNASRAANVGNQAVGLLLTFNGSNAQILENTIAFNGFAAPSGGLGGTTSPAGVRIYGALGGATGVGNGNLISRNSIFANFGPGIDLSDDSVTLNDVPPASTPPDQDIGPNLLQNYPVLTSVTNLNPGTRIQGTLSSTPSSLFRLEFYANPERNEKTLGLFGTYGEGKTLIGTLDVTTDPSGLATFSVDLAVDLHALPGATGQPFVAATATDITDTGSGPQNNTSEFSLVEPLGGLSFVVTNTGEMGLGTLREAIYSANFTAGAQTITFSIPASDPRHFYYKDDGIADSVTLANIATTTAATDAAIPTTGASAIDPDWPHSWFSIQPARELPVILDRLAIDGFSQLDAQPNSQPAPQGLDTVLKIELDGSKASGSGLRVSRGNESFVAMIIGLGINRWKSDGIILDTIGGNFILGNFIGTDISGKIGLDNERDGIRFENEAASYVGGSASSFRNLIAANGNSEVHAIQGGGHSIQGNLIGTDRTGLKSLGTASGIILEESGVNEIGSPATANVISPIGGSGIIVASSASAKSIFSIMSTSGKSLKEIKEDCDHLMNQVHHEEDKVSDLGVALGLFHTLSFGSDIEGRVEDFVDGCIQPLKAIGAQDELNKMKALIAPYPPPSNAALLLSADSTSIQMIDLNNDGITLNDSDNPNTPEVDPDSDNGPNGLQNYPVLVSSIVVGQSTVITGSLNSLTNEKFHIEFYSNSVGNSFRAGQQYLGFLNVTTNSQGNASFTFNSPTVVPDGQFITSTATWLLDTDDDPATPLDPIETSEFSDVIPVRDNPWYNKAQPLDVNKDTHVVADDVLDIINRINAFGSGPIPPDAVYGVPNFYDTTNDANVAADDVLKIINAGHAEEEAGEGYSAELTSIVASEANGPAT